MISDMGTTNAIHVRYPRIAVSAAVLASQLNLNGLSTTQSSHPTLQIMQTLVYIRMRRASVEIVTAKTTVNIK